MAKTTGIGDALSGAVPAAGVLDGKTAAVERGSRPAAGAPKKMAGPREPGGNDRAPEPRPPTHPFFEIYKRGQGKHLRWWTAGGAAVLIVGGAYAINNRLTGVLPDAPWAVWIRALIPVAWCAALSILLYWLVGVNRKTCDFLIATEGEMKKVSWTTKRELWGSTKVVIFTTLLMGVLLFVVDVSFMLFFSWIGVLHGPPVLKSLFGGGSP
ncbi:MAG TPA: preprotein translocase subunit SecE [Phycisphaerae bacterium]|jgi:preprotein translocase subunit SecE